ncbi:molybdopterin oxidoreductase family protein [Skermanella mucosa]|uniref:molybdopterin-containing oxidoreductase family protein n=1 Tax=Skermanella mucosa TaxID=1789672 RepID=UPI00192C0E58|nr:molybdopterin oxidoreductase family protein [Skermanella mucosa]UEM19332.1 molybdopterin oxidoreductase family protein [Skermanella mucosa]
MPDSTFVPSVCPHDCPSTCALEVERVAPNRIGRVRGAPDNSYTDGVICAKVSRYAERVHHPDRLTRPLQRVGAKGEGKWREIPFDAALDIVAERFAGVAREHGPEAVWPYYYAGTMGHVQRDGIERLRNVMGYSRQATTICTALADAGWLAGNGVKRGADPREMALSDLIVVWGGNPVATQVNVMSWISRARKERGAKLVVVDPYRTGTAERADLHLAPRPGTDGALACAVMHVLFREGYADRDYMARYADVPDELERHLATRTPAWAAGITGLDEEAIVGFARLYGSTRRSFLRLGYGFSRSRNGSAQMHAVSCLPVVTGAWAHEGGGALYSNSAIYRLDKTLIEGRDRLDPKVRVLDMSRIGPVLVGERDALGAGPQVHAMLIQNTNPATVAPESEKVRAGLLRDDLFVCVHEQFMTDTARLADIVLPATMMLEHDDLYTAGGQMHLQVGTRQIDPPGECRENHEVIRGLARRLGAEHPGFGMSAWELVDATLKASGWPDAATLRDKRWHDCIAETDSHFSQGFGTPDRRFHFKPDWSRVGPNHADMPALPDHFDVIESATDEHPYRLVAPPARQFLNSSFTETPSARKREGRPTALVHPEDCARLGLADGGLVRIGNRRGSVLVHVRPFDGLQAGVVVVEGIWPNDCFVEGRGINVLTGADPGRPLGGAVFHDTAVWLRAG